MSFWSLRQLQNPPRVDNFLSDHQKDSIKADMNRLHVNAQVTCMILLLEILFSFIQVTLLIIFKAHTFPTLINGIFLWSIVLPHSFLMNTSHNKRRIIEKGWVNVLRNVFKLAAPINGHQVPQNSVRKNNQHLNLSSQKSKGANRTSFLSSVSCKNFEGTSNSKSFNEKSLYDDDYAAKSLNDSRTHRKYEKRKKGNNIPVHSSKSNSLKIKQNSMALVKKNYTTQKGTTQELKVIDLAEHSDLLFNFKVQNAQR